MWSWWTFVYCCEGPWTFVIGLFWVTWNIVNITTFGVPIVYIFSSISIHLCYLDYNKVLIVCTLSPTTLHLNWSNCKKVPIILIVCTCWVLYLSIWIGKTITKSIKSLQFVHLSPTFVCLSWTNDNKVLIVCTFESYICLFELDIV
jgi:hypothetical protein